MSTIDPSHSGDQFNISSQQHQDKLEILALKEALADLQAKCVEAATRAFDAADKLHENIKTLERQLDAMRKQRDEYNSKFTALQRDYSDLQANTDIANARVAELTEKLLGLTDHPEGLPSVDEVLNNFSTTYWLQESLNEALHRDPVDASRDAELLAALLRRRAKETI